jgi:hypothetical protein
MKLYFGANRATIRYNSYGMLRVGVHVDDVTIKHNTFK